VQNQIENKVFLREIGAIMKNEDLNFANLVAGNEIDTGKPGEPGGGYDGRGSLRPTVMANGTLQKVLD